MQHSQQHARCARYPSTVATGYQPAALIQKSTQLPQPAVTGSSHAQVVPLPLYPMLQAHVKPPGVLAQAAFALQLCVAAVHSLMSE